MHQCFCTIISLFFFASAATSLQSQIELGNFRVGLKDTVIFDVNFQYNQYGYNGNKPMFIQIWFPLADSSTSEALTPNEMFSRNIPSSLKATQYALDSLSKEIIYRDAFTENIETESALAIDSLCYDYFKEYYNYTTHTYSTKNPIPDGFPIIVYHHGSQSCALENIEMAEYFASHGFIFIAANFHLPYPNTTFGLKPYQLIQAGEDESYSQLLINFGQAICPNQKIYYIGHSWGAQQGWLILDGETTLSGFISLETTLEFQTDMPTIEDFWPELNAKFLTPHLTYSIPILMIAATGNDELPIFFQRANFKDLSYIGLSEDFYHNSYTSIFFARKHIHATYPQPDISVLNSQYQLYLFTLQEMLHFLESH